MTGFSIEYIIVMVKQKKSKKIFFIILILVLFTAATAGSIYYLNKDETKTSTKSGDSSLNKSELEPNVPTFESTSEGSTFDVPNNVDPSSIRNYTLLTENELYKIRELNNEYYVTLYPILNNPSQYSTYQDNLREYKQQALNYLKNSGIDVTNSKIHYEPSDATDL